MVHGGRFKKGAAVLVVLLVAMALSFAGPAAEAATGYGTQATWSVSDNGWTASLAGCSGDAQYQNAGGAGGQTVFLPDLNCSWGNLAGFSADHAYLDITFDNGVVASGNGFCSYVAPEVNWSGSQIQGITALGGAGCQVTEICIAWHVSASSIDPTHLGSDSGTMCSGLSLGTFPTVGAGAQACPFASGISPPWVAHDPNNSDSASLSFFDNIASASIPAGYVVRGYVVDASGNELYSYPSNPSSRLTPNPPGSNLVGPSGDYAAGQVAGEGLWITQPVYTDNSLPQDDGGAGLIGVNDPGRCVFYWGAKVANTGQATDNPAGPLGSAGGGGSAGTGTNPAPPPAKDSGCGFSITSPSTWAGGGICEMVGLLSKLLSIPGAILNGLVGLFVPSSWPNFMDIPSPIPAGWIPTFPALDDGSCGALTIPAVSLGRMVGNVTPKSYVDTCSGPWPAIHEGVYNGILAAELIGLGFAGYGAVRKALGIDVHVESAE